VHLRGRAPQQLDRHLDQLAKTPPESRQHLTREEFAQQYGARPADIAAVRRFAANHNLNVVSVHPERRTVELSGTVAAMNDAFGVDLGLHRSSTGVLQPVRHYSADGCRGPSRRTDQCAGRRSEQR